MIAPNPKITVSNDSDAAIDRLGRQFSDRLGSFRPREDG